MVSGNFDLKNEFLPQESSSSLLLGKLNGSSPVQASETRKQSKPLTLLLLPGHCPNNSAPEYTCCYQEPMVYYR